MTMSALSRDTVDIGGGRLEYHHRGPLADRRGRPIVFMHPWYGCWQFWQRPIDALPEFEIYAVDLYSLGANDNWQDFASPEGIARAIGGMIDGLRLSPAVVIGNSMGGIAAQALAATRPADVDKLVLVGTGARTVGVKPEWRKQIDDWVAGDADRAFTERMVAALMARRPEDPQEFETFVDMVAGANKAFMGMVINTAFNLDLRLLLPRIASPTLVVRGALDASRTQAHVDELLAGIPNSRAVEIPNAGHSPQVDSAEVFSRVVREFLLT